MWGLKVLLLQFAVIVFVNLCTSQDDPPRPYPLSDGYLSTTSILNHIDYITGFDDQQWYLDNIPFIDIPDESIQEVYYYRTSVIKRHLKFSHNGHGWLFTEFIHPVSWASKLQTIPDSAAHQILEGRWLRDQRYSKDVINLYMRAGIESLSGISYTHYIHRAIYEHAQATGDIDFLKSQLEGMIKTYNLWNTTLDSSTGLYHRTPLSDAQEYSLPGWVTGGPNGGPVEDWFSFENDFATIWLGPETYRPNFNAYMVAGARAISEVAGLAGDDSLASQWNQTAESLYGKMLALLWNEDIQFWIDVVQGTNLEVVGRQLIGYFPYRLDVGTEQSFVRALEVGLTGEEFLTEYGPTTLEQTNRYYTALKNTTYCCLWQGQSWPFSTSMYLGTLARIAYSNLSTIVTSEFFQEAFTTYTQTNYKDGTPYTAECHYPTIDSWSGDTTNHSEHYLHSTYLDNFFTNFIGIIPTLDDRLELRPLIPDNWTYFVVENLPYHGSLFTILWDQTGTHYTNINHTAGLSIYSNATLIHNQATLTALNLTLFNGSEAAKILSNQPTYENILINPNAPWGLPNISADYTFSSNGDISPYPAWKLNDGLLWYDTTPDNRWTNNQSETPFNTLTINLPRPRPLTSISVAICDDTDRGGVIACPSAIIIRDRDGNLVASRNPWTSCKGNSLNTVVFDATSTSNSSSSSSVSTNSTNNSTTPATATIPTTTTDINSTIITDYLTITLANTLYYSIAISEIQLWVPTNLGPRYEVEDGLLGTFIGGFEGKESGLNCSIRDGGVVFGVGAWAEIAGVQATTDDSGSASGGSGGLKNVTVIGGGAGTLALQMNFLSNVTLEFGGDGNGSDDGSSANQTVEVPFLPGRNVVTFFWVEGSPWVDAFVVG